MNRALIGALALLCGPSPAFADPALCGTRADITAALADRFHETLSSVGIEQRGAVLELWTSADGLTWTLLVSGTEGQTCVVAAGVQWKAVPPPGIPL